MNHTILRAALACASLAIPGSLSLGQAPLICPPEVFSGDAAILPSVAVQRGAAISAGGPGYLVVWEDQRAVLSGTVGTAYAPLMGNQTDIYGARLDAAGNLLDALPILVCNLGRNQTRPRVAWNGESWLVVFMTERPDWYFYAEVAGVRIAADGTVLDSTPIQIRPYEITPYGNSAYAPDVASDGVNWFVVWEDVVWQGSISYPTVEGTRIDAQGNVLDPQYAVLEQHTVAAFGPREPQVGFAGHQYVLTWKEAASSEVRGRGIGADLALLGPGSFLVMTTGAYSHRMATAPAQHFVVAGAKGVRLSTNGTVLDPAGIAIPSGVTGWQETPPDVGWTGASWAVAFNGSEPGGVTGSDVWLSRVGADGVPLDGVPLPVATTSFDEDMPVVAGNGAGGALVAFRGWDPSNGQRDDVRAAAVDAAGAAGPWQPISVGLARQGWLDWCEAGSVRLAVWVSESSGVARILAQRYDLDGDPIDADPVLVHQGTESNAFRPAAAFNGTHFLVVWNLPSGGVVGRKLTPDLELLGFGTPLLLTPGGAPGVAALGNDFLVAATYLYSGDQSYLHGIRIDGDTLAPLDAGPFSIGGDYSLLPEIATLGGRWLVVWTRFANHDSTTSTVQGRFVGADGTLFGAQFAINVTGEGEASDVAVLGDRALIVWSDDTPSGQDRIEGRVLLAGGTFATGELLIGDAAGQQRFPSAGTDGTQFAVAWTDYRSNPSIEQLRGDVYAGRVALDGTLIDGPLGIQLTSGELPEDLPAVTGGGGRAVVAYMALGGAGGVPEVQRLTYRVIGCDWCQPDLGFGGPGTALLEVCGEQLATGAGATLQVSGAPPLSPGLFVASQSNAPLPILGGTLVPWPPSLLLDFATDPSGTHLLPVNGGHGPASWFLQAVVIDPTQAQSLAFSNAVEVQLLP